MSRIDNIISDSNESSDIQLVKNSYYWARNMYYITKQDIFIEHMQTATDYLISKGIKVEDL